MRKRVRAGGDPKSLKTGGRFSFRKRMREFQNEIYNAVTVFVIFVDAGYRLRKKNERAEQAVI